MESARNLFFVVLLCCSGWAQEAPNNGGGSAPGAETSPNKTSVLERPSLLDGPGSAKEALRKVGINVDLWLTQFYQGLANGEGGDQWQYGGKGNVIVSIDARKLGLWRGLSFVAHQEFLYGNDVNKVSDGSIIPVNTALAFPRLGGSELETSLLVSQVFSPRITATFGKFNMLDAAARSPLVGGGGLDTFMNLAIAAPISGVTPPYLFGGSLALRTKPVTFSFLVYDPRNAQSWDVIKSAFDEGVTVSSSATIPLQISNRPGFHSLRLVLSTKDSVDPEDDPQLQLPSQLLDEPAPEATPWYVSYSFQQFLHQNPADPSKGWGVFGELAVSEGETNPMRAHYFFGVGGNSFLTGRPNDRWGVSYFNYRLSGFLHDPGIGILFREERGLEAYYNVAVTPWCRFTGNVQVVKPFPEDRGNAVIVGFRLQIRL